MKKKLSIKEVQIKSFVTSLDESQQEIAKGGKEIKLPTIHYRCFTGYYPSVNAPCTD
ncbi:pinensin family lanthipeptide [Luteibaculum oceani]|uniref:pinensin family lanthipeptide n=1 Tax=Luteibaculum oceani TaxID=1294296 RepID=UPI0014773628|nr:pinensin family lanthipeptide [Luteibaculum oceani]